MSDGMIAGEGGSDAGGQEPADAADTAWMSPKERAIAAIKAGRIPGGRSTMESSPSGQGTEQAAGESRSTEDAGSSPADSTDADPIAAKVAEVAKRLEARRAEAAAKTEAEQLDAKIAAAKLDPAMLRTEKGREHLSTWCEATGVDPIALYDALTDWGEELAAKAKANPLETRLEKIERQQREEAERKAAEEQAAQGRYLRELFLSAVTPDKYPLLSSLEPDEIMERGIAAAVALKSAGEDADAETIAALVEVQLRKLHSKLAAKGSGSSAPGRGEPRTLAGSLGGETPEPPVYASGEDGRRARARALLDRLGNR